MSNKAGAERNAELRQAREFTDAYLDECLREIVEEPKGRYVMQWVLELAGVLKAPATGSSRTYSDIGRQELGLAVRERIVELNPAHVFHMEQEYREVERKAREGRGR